MKLPRNNKFGSLDFLSKPVSDSIKLLITSLEKDGISFDIYYGYPIIDENDRKEYVKGFIVTESGIIILFEHDEEEDLFASCLLNHLSNDSSLFKISRDYSKFVKSHNIKHSTYDNLKILLQERDLFSEMDILKINRAIQKAYNLTSKDEREVSSEYTLGSQLKKRNNYIGSYDSTQFNMVHSPITSHQRIRGLAGSGKTILMLKKLAFLHYNNPNLTLAFVFYTTSLKESMVRQFEAFYRDYDRYGKPDMTKVNIFHAWGGKRKGFYSDLCGRIEVDFKNFGDAVRHAKGQDPFEYVCSDLIEKMEEIDYSGIYDYIFIDEAQDFGLNFYRLCLRALKRTTSTIVIGEKSGFLIYAYDELQSLRDEVKIPSKEEIFADEECIDINLTRSYRAPVELLTTAHAIGLGIYRDVPPGENPIVNYVNEQNFIDMGYENSYDGFTPGQQVCLFRNEEKSGVEIPEPVGFESEIQQYTYVSKMILDFIINQDVLPSDIMIIDLDENYLTQDHETFSKIFYEVTSGQAIEQPIRIKLMNSKTLDRIFNPNALVYTSVYRAKGNEANLVILLNCNSVPVSSRNSLNRNKLFTAMTRSKWQVWLFGKNIESFTKEIETVRSKDYKLEFRSPTAEELRKIKILGAKEETIDNKTTSVEDILKDLPADVIKSLLEKHLGKG
ncbi:ATP-binding domain-containing protein [Streptococcus suis]|uniref:DEAD/DEAH box helicase n=1 Tax=Streptococcus suis TaxID=1307 RepID=UPI0005CDCD2B|nr:ATP-binding domain-containing protein [Streptococcus suis]NRG80123.1 ATP-binding domain-containing protein [Streptococcus suis]CZA69752.1 Superfamily I DNA and RNA helicases [Streptococcus suis]CZB30201.1 Superfamily I DNA and RNA helicases [Streptococcus suis]